MTSETLPLLCRQCGGPVQATGTLDLQCPYCGTHDRLPEDQLSRAMELKRRIQQARNMVLRVEGIDQTLSSIYERRFAFVAVTWPWLLVALAVLAQIGVQAWPMIEKAPANMRVGMMISALTGPLFVAGFAVALTLALLVGRIRYRLGVRKRLFARPPFQPGMPARCRACGGALTESRDAVVACRHCTTSNLVGPELQRDRERLLAAETEHYRQRAQGSFSASVAAGTHMSRVLVVSVVLVYVGIIGLQFLASSLLTT